MGRFGNSKILLKAQCGSRGFGFETEASDNDILIVLDKNIGFAFEKDEQTDYFVFGLETFRKLLKFDDSLADYLLVFNDQFLDLKIDYLDESFKEEYLKLSNIDWKKDINNWINHVIPFFERYLFEGTTEAAKPLYHLLRINDIVKRYEVTGTFDHNYSEETIRKVYSFRQNNKSCSLDEFRNIIEYLKGFVGRE